MAPAESGPDEFPPPCIPIILFANISPSMSPVGFVLLYYIVGRAILYMLKRRRLIRATVMVNLLFVLTFIRTSKKNICHRPFI